MLLRPGKQPSPALFNLCFCSVIWVPSDLSRTLKIPVVTAFRVIPVCLPASIHPSVHPFLPSLCQEAMLKETSLTNKLPFCAHARTRTHTCTRCKSCNAQRNPYFLQQQNQFKTLSFQSSIQGPITKESIWAWMARLVKAFLGLLLVLKGGIQPVFRGLKAVVS